MSLLLGSGADPDSRTNKGYTPLHGASERGHIDVVRRLLGGGASVNVLTNEGFTPLHSASHYNQTEAVQLLLQAGAKVGSSSSATAKTPLHAACAQGNHLVASVLLGAGADPRARLSDSGSTCLHLACSATPAPHFAVVDVVLEHDPDARLEKDDSGQLPACEYDIEYGERE